jgi:hypothetical protein
MSHQEKSANSTSLCAGAARAVLLCARVLTASASMPYVFCKTSANLEPHQTWLLHILLLELQSNFLRPQLSLLQHQV